MVIENAREKILSNKSLQEKLAENINKFLTIHDRILSQGKIKRQMKIGGKLSNIYHIGLIFLICKECLHLK